MTGVPSLALRARVPDLVPSSSEIYLTMFRLLVCALGLLLIGLPAWTAVLAADKPVWSIKATESEPPEEIQKPVRALLKAQAVQLFENEELVLELWFRREVPVEATATQFENGLTWAEVPSSTVLAVLHVVRETNDYRKQKLAPGFYTLRVARQPPNDDHNGTAPTTDFCLVCPAAADPKPDLLEVKPLRELSAKITEGKHPSPLLLFPGKGATATPKLVDHGEGHRVLHLEIDARSGENRGKLKIGLTLVGASSRI
jgi:hypothetical protein